MSAATTHDLHASLADVLDRLAAESPAYGGWLAARSQGVDRERQALLARLTVLRGDLDRLLVDVDHHLQRQRDLAWDEVELELGGSE